MPTRRRCSSPGSSAIRRCRLCGWSGIFRLHSRSSTVFRSLSVGSDCSPWREHRLRRSPWPRCRSRSGGSSGDVRTATIWSVKSLRQVLLQDLATLGELQRIDGGVRGPQLPLQLLGEERVDAVQAATEQHGVGRRRRRPSLRRPPREREEAPRGADPRHASSRGSTSPIRSSRRHTGCSYESSTAWSARRRAAPRPACARSAGAMRRAACESASSDSNRRVTSSMTCRSIGSLALATQRGAMLVEPLAVDVTAGQRCARTADAAAARRGAAAPARARGCGGSCRRCARRARRRPELAGASSRTAARTRGMLGEQRAQRSVRAGSAQRSGRMPRPTAERRSDRRRAARPRPRVASTPPPRRSSAARRRRRPRCAGRSRAAICAATTAQAASHSADRVDERPERIRLGVDVAAGRRAST